MADDTKKEVTVREKLAELVGVDPGSADNDEALVGALEEWVGGIEAQIERKAVELSEAHEERLRDEVRKGIEFEVARDEILARAEERRTARAESAQQDINRKGQANIEEAAKASDDIVARVKGAQTNALSGVVSLALHGTQSISDHLKRPVANDDPIKLLQRAHDDMLLTRDLLMVGDPDGKYASMDDLQTYKAFKPLYADLTKAFATGDAAAWTPTYYSADLIENVYQMTDVARLFPRFPWPGPGGTATIPAEGDDIDLYTAGEATLDDGDSKFTASDPGVGTSVVVTARAFAARTVWSWELEEDSIIPILGHIRAKFSRAFARQFDRALLDGDADGTHQDTGLSLSANDTRRLFNGLRRKAIADSPADASTYWNAEKVMEPILNMGAFGQPSTSQELPANGTVGICSWATRLKLGFLRDTKDQRVGGAHAPLTSSVSGLMGYPIQGSAMVRNDLNDSGVYDGSTTTKTYILWVYAPAWHIYDKADLTMQVIDRPETGQRVMVARQRCAFQHMYGSSDTTTRMVHKFVDTSF